MEYMRVVVQRENSIGTEPVKVFEQAVESEKFNMKGVIAAINTPPRAPRVRKGKPDTPSTGG